MQDTDSLTPFALIVLLIAYVAIEFAHMRWRAHAMKAFANRHGFAFRPGTHTVLSHSQEPPIPYTFRPSSYPANTLDQTWNVIQGEVKGLQVLILDSNLNIGHRNQRTCTFIAAKAQVSPFLDRDSSEQFVLTNGWYALYRRNFFGQPTTMSIKRLERHLESFSPSKIDL